MTVDQEDIINVFAVASDVEIITTRLNITPPSELPVQKFPVEMYFIADDIALEDNETFTLTLSGLPLVQLGANSTIRDTMTGIVHDNTGKDAKLHLRIPPYMLDVLCT